MKVVNLMNFVRQIDERKENSTARLLEFTTKQLRFVNGYDIPNTFLLQYDALCNPDFVSLFQNEATDKTELGLWYEIVEPLTTACGMPYRSEVGWKWDWHIIPGFSMAYAPRERERLIDEAMRKVREVFGAYPRTVASWLIDTHTVNYLAEHYDISAIAICRDQANTDAYTLLGGYFNQAYYPSKKNMFTPAQTQEMQNNVPMFRLLGPCPIRNYDNHKYSSEAFVKAQGENAAYAIFTLEPCGYIGSTPETIRWMFDTFYGGESLGFAYAQIGQENSFLDEFDQIIRGLTVQIEHLLERGDVEFRTMAETGEAFKRLFPTETPATSVFAKDNFDTTDVQSVYYDSKNYTANLFRFEDKLFLRSLYLFDERVEDAYLKRTCTTFDAVYENLPIVDTREGAWEDKKRTGLMLDRAATPFTASKAAEGVLEVAHGADRIRFYPDRIELTLPEIFLYAQAIKAEWTVEDGGLSLLYKGHRYRLDVAGARLDEAADGLAIVRTGECITLYPRPVL